MQGKWFFFLLYCLQNLCTFKHSIKFLLLKNLLFSPTNSIKISVCAEDKSCNLYSMKIAYKFPNKRAIQITVGWEQNLRPKKSLDFNTKHSLTKLLHKWHRMCKIIFLFKFLWLLYILIASIQASMPSPQFASYTEDHCNCERKSWLTNLKALNRINPGSVSFVGSPFMALIKKLVAKQATIEEKNWKEKNKSNIDISCIHRLYTPIHTF